MPPQGPTSCPRTISSVSNPLERLTDEQRALLARWLPGAKVEADHSWGLVETTVLEVVHDGARLVVKAGGARDHHLEREIRAHLAWLGPWVRRGRAAVARHHDVAAKLLVTDFLPGRLVLGSPEADEPGTYRQAGELLALLHAQTGHLDEHHEERDNARALRWLDGPHRLADDTVERLREEIRSWPTPPAYLVPTHGDWQPRNWLVDDGVVRVIDFGRAAMRPAMTDLVRLATQELRRGPALETAFLDGYGTDPREPAAWHRHRVREAIGTACWAFQVGEKEFEAHGHRMVSEVLAATR